MDPKNPTPEGDPRVGVNIQDAIPESSVEIPDETYCIKNSGIRAEYTNEEVFADSACFDEVERVGETVKYEAPGIEAKIDSNEGAVEYAVEQNSVKDRAVQEFVEGIVRSMDDVNAGFQDEIREEVYDRKIAADGGGEKGMPTGGMPNYIETNEDGEAQSMGDFPM